MEAFSRQGTVGVQITPSDLTYEPGNSPLLYYRDPGAASDVGTLVYMDDQNYSYIMPTLASPGIGYSTFIPHNSEYQYARKTYTRKEVVGGRDVPVWELNIGDPSSGPCNYDVHSFDNTVAEYIHLIIDPEKIDEDALGIAHPSCEYQPSQVSITASSEPGYKLVTIKDHAPKLQSLTLIPSKQSWGCITDCSATEAQTLYDGVLKHELGHVGVYQDFENELVSNNLVIPGLKVEAETGGLTDDEIEEWAYQEWCNLRVLIPEIKPLNKQYHDSPEGKVDYSKVTCQCLLGTSHQDPEHPQWNCMETEPAV